MRLVDLTGIQLRDSPSRCTSHLELAHTVLSMTIDRYGRDALSSPQQARPTSRQVPATIGLVVEEVTTGWVGAILRVEKSGGMQIAVIENRRGVIRSFPIGPGFWIDGEPVELVAPLAPASADTGRSVSGAVKAPASKARVARGSRIWVEGRHDAELVEKVWGDDLRSEGVVVEILEGIDNLAEELAAFEPTKDRRVGVLVDHLVTGSKEQRIADQVQRQYGSSILVLGHPYVDVWQSVRPDRLGMEAWPVIDRSVEWKVGIMAELGWPHRDQADTAQAWKRILATVRDYHDLEPSLLGRVEELIDFVTIR